MKNYTCANPGCGKTFDRMDAKLKNPCCSRKCAAAIKPPKSASRVLSPEAIIARMKTTGCRYDRGAVAAYFGTTCAEVAPMLSDMVDMGLLQTAIDGKDRVYFLPVQHLPSPGYEPQFRPLRGYESGMRRAVDAMLGGR